MVPVAVQLRYRCAALAFGRITRKADISPEKDMAGSGQRHVRPKHDARAGAAEARIEVTQALKRLAGQP
jgi:hypothetical protein